MGVICYPTSKRRREIWYRCGKSTSIRKMCTNRRLLYTHTHTYAHTYICVCAFQGVGCMLVQGVGKAVRELPSTDGAIFLQIFHMQTRFRERKGQLGGCLTTSLFFIQTKVESIINKSTHYVVTER